MPSHTPFSQMPFHNAKYSCSSEQTVLTHKDPQAWMKCTNSPKANYFRKMVQLATIEPSKPSAQQAKIHSRPFAVAFGSRPPYSVTVPCISPASFQSSWSPIIATGSRDFGSHHGALVFHVQEIEESSNRYDSTMNNYMDHISQVHEYTQS